MDAACPQKGTAILMKPMGEYDLEANQLKKLFVAIGVEVKIHQNIEEKKQLQNISEFIEALPNSSINVLFLIVFGRTIWIENLLDSLAKSKNLNGCSIMALFANKIRTENWWEYKKISTTKLPDHVFVGHLTVSSTLNFSSHIIQNYKCMSWSELWEEWQKKEQRLPEVRAKLQLMPIHKRQSKGK